MATINHRSDTGPKSAAAPDQENSPAPSDLIQRLELPEEVTAQQAAAILGCCKHTVLQHLEQGVLEWRNLAPPSSQRPVFRITLRSVLELRLGYQRGSPRPPQSAKPARAHRRPASAAYYQPKHLRRKKRDAPDGDEAPSAEPGTADL